LFRSGRGNRLRRFRNVSRGGLGRRALRNMSHISPHSRVTKSAENHHNRKRGRETEWAPPTRHVNRSAREIGARHHLVRQRMNLLQFLVQFPCFLRRVEKAFDFSLRSSLFQFRIKGRVEGNTLVLAMDERRQTIPLDTKIHLSSGLLDGLAQAPLKPGDSVRLFVFDPASLGQRPVLVTLLGEEPLEVMGRMQQTRKYAVDFMGQSQTAWVGEDGTVVQEQGLMGFTLKRVTQAQALEAADASQDLTRLVAVPLNRPLERPAELERLELIVGGLEQPLALDGDRQTFAGGQLTIRREAPPEAGAVPEPASAAFLAATPMIEADHPDIAALARQLAPATDAPPQRVGRILDWISRHIAKRPVLSVPSALATLKQRMGDCNEHAVLFAALARAAGIPTRVEAGLVYMDGRFYYHAWNVVNLGRWITVDSLMNQFPADVTHIRLVRGEAAEQLDLMGVIGRLTLEVVDAR